MKTVQNTTIGGSVGLAAFIGVVRFNFQDIPIADFMEHVATLEVGQMIDMAVPLVLGIAGIFYDEEHEEKAKDS